MGEHRTEWDSLGPVEVPAEAYWGAQTQRAVENFPISGQRLPPLLIRALGTIKAAAAMVNLALGLLEPRLAEAIRQAAEEVAAGRHDEQFPVDVFQTGSGTSSNMNANEVIAGRANELLAGARGGKQPVHPNDHVNLGQSSNDVFPTAIHLAAAGAIERELAPALEALQGALERRGAAFAEVVKCGRTHLQDAVPLTLAQEFSGYASQIAHGRRRLAAAADELAELAIGGTAVGTGLGAHPEFGVRMVEELSRRTGLVFRPAENPFEAIAARDACVAASGALRTIACSLTKLAVDLRWLASGPRCGLGELRLPVVQPGSSIMPGKVNPVIPEAVQMVAAQVVGNDAAIALGGLGGNLELNVMQPLIAKNLLESIGLLARGCRVFALRCIDGIEADAERCRGHVERSFALVTALVPHIGYDRAAEIAAESFRSGRSVAQIAREEQVLPADELDRVLDPLRMTRPGG